MNAKQLFETIRACADHQISTTAEGCALRAIAGDDLDKLIRLIARNSAQAISLELDNEFCGEEPTVPVTIGAEAAPGIVVVERCVA